MSCLIFILKDRDMFELGSGKEWSPTQESKQGKIETILKDWPRLVEIEKSPDSAWRERNTWTDLKYIVRVEVSGHV